MGYLAIEKLSQIVKKDYFFSPLSDNVFLEKADTSVSSEFSSRDNHCNKKAEKVPSKDALYLRIPRQVLFFLNRSFS